MEMDVDGGRGDNWYLYDRYKSILQSVWKAVSRFNGLFLFRTNSSNPLLIR